MEIQVHGSAQLSDSLREAITRKVLHAARFFDSDHAVVDVELDEESNPRLAAERFRMEITAAPMAGQVLRVEAAGPDGETALDAALDKFEKQLRRLKGKLITRSRSDDHKRLNQGLVPVEEEEDDHGPHIVRVKRFEMKPMTPEEAALQMDLLDHAFFFFHNAETDLPSVLYRRRDGALGLIEPA